MIGNDAYVNQYECLLNKQLEIIGSQCYFFVRTYFALNIPSTAIPLNLTQQEIILPEINFFQLFLLKFSMLIWYFFYLLVTIRELSGISAGTNEKYQYR